MLLADLTKRKPDSTPVPHLSQPLPVSKAQDCMLSPARCSVKSVGRCCVLVSLNPSAPTASRSPPVTPERVTRSSMTHCVTNRQSTAPRPPRQIRSVRFGSYFLWLVEPLLPPVSRNPASRNRPLTALSAVLGSRSRSHGFAPPASSPTGCLHSQLATPVRPGTRVYINVSLSFRQIRHPLICINFLRICPHFFLAALLFKVLPPNDFTRPRDLEVYPCINEMSRI